MTTMARHLWTDLLGKPYGRRGCWALVSDVYRRLGIAVPRHPDPDVGWRKVATPTAGALVYMTGEDGKHVGIYIGRGQVLHSTARTGVSVARLADLAPTVLGYYWPDGAAVPVLGPGEAGDWVTVVDLDLVTGERSATRQAWPWSPPDAEARVIAGRNEPGGVVVVTRTPGELTTILLGVGLSLLGAGLQLLLSPSVPKPRDRSDPSSPAFDLSGNLFNTAGVGQVQPLVYGERRQAGHIISAFQRSDGSGRSLLYMLVMLSRGPVESIAGLTSAQDDLTGSSIPEDIQIDGNPASQYDCSISVRLGDYDQEPIPGFRETINTTSYAVTLYVGQPYTHVGTQDAEALEVVFSFPEGLYNLSNSSGAVGPRTFTYVIRHRQRGTSTWTSTAWQQVIGARRGAFSHTHRIDGLAKNTYEVQVERIAPPYPETQADKASRSDLVEIHEITTDQLSYPGKALLGIIAASTDQLNGIPNVTVKMKGIKVPVWTSGAVTSPTFTSQWSDNPAWITLDLLTNPYHGLGRSGRFSLSNIDLQSFQDWADACDALVSDGRGSTAPLAVCDLVVDQPEHGWDYVQSVALSHFAWLIHVGRKVRAVVQEDATPVYAFSAGNVKDVEITYVARTEQPNTVDVQYVNEETNYEPDTASRYDLASVVTNGELQNIESLQAVGVTRPVQAYRLAVYRLNIAQKSTRRLRFTTGWEALHLVPGDIFYFSHIVDGKSVSGRILNADSNSDIYLDHDITAGATTYITVRQSDDTVEEVDVPAGTYARNTTISLGTPLAMQPDPGVVYAVGDQATYRRQYRITDIEVLEDLTRRITAVEHDATIYDHDPDPVEEFTDVMPDPRAVPTAVENLTAREQQSQTADGTRLDSVLVEWDRPESWGASDVWYRVAITPTIDDAYGGTPPWLYAGRFLDRCEIHNVPGSASITVSVVPVSPRSAKRSPDYGTLASVYVRGWRARPTTPSAVRATVSVGMLTLEVEKVSDVSVVGYQFRIGSTWGGSWVLHECAPNVVTVPCPFVGTATIRVRSVNRFGVVSASEVTTSATHTAAPSMHVRDVNSDEHTAFSGTKTNTTVTSSKLVLSGSNTTGTYQTADKNGALPKARSALAVNVDAGLNNVERIVDDCGMYVGDATQTVGAFYLNGFEVAEGLTVGNCGFTVGSLAALMLTVAGPTDVVAALTPTIEYDLDTGGGFSGSWTKFRTPVEALNTGVRVKATLNRPHTSYDPYFVSLNTSTLVAGSYEPERFNYEFYNYNALAAGSRAVGFISDATTNGNFEVPSGKKLSVIQATAAITTGATAGTYTIDVIVRNDTDSSDVVVATGTSAVTSTAFRFAASGTRAAPLGTLAAGKRYRIGWLNRATSPGALTATMNHCHIVCVLEDA
jgi:predicted phage tail protein